jgi:hypothetical protein
MLPQGDEMALTPLFNAGSVLILTRLPLPPRRTAAVHHLAWQHSPPASRGILRGGWMLHLSRGGDGRDGFGGVGDESMYPMAGGGGFGAGHARQAASPQSAYQPSEAFRSRLKALPPLTDQTQSLYGGVVLVQPALINSSAGTTRSSTRLVTE